MPIRGWLTQILHPRSGGCPHCHTSWKVAHPHCTDIDFSGGIGVICQECWVSLHPEQRLPYYREHYMKWRKSLTWSWDQIERAVMEEPADEVWPGWKNPEKYGWVPPSPPAPPPPPPAKDYERVVREQPPYPRSPDPPPPAESYEYPRYAVPPPAAPPPKMRNFVSPRKLHDL